jgi:F-type H+-transporting ATPase subunit b
MIPVCLNGGVALAVPQEADVHRADQLDEPAHGPASDEDEHAAAPQGGHHDPYDLTAANAGKTQQDFTEIRSDLALATLLVFLILLGILWKFAWRPISEALERREKGIADQLAEARRNNEEAHRLLAEHRHRLDQAAEEVRGLLDQARKDGESLKQRMVAEADQAAATQKDRALREIEAAKNGALEELARTSIDQAVGLAGRIVGKNLKKEDHAQLIQDALERMPSPN